MAYNLNIREEELKNKVAQDYFWLYDNTKIIGDVDFCVAMHQSASDLLEHQSLLWAEAKKGKADIYKSFVQLILTIGKARTFDKFLPPVMLGAFDATKIGFIPYNDIQEIFYLNDFNWSVTPSCHDSREFNLLLQKVHRILDKNTFVFNYEKDDKELKNFIKTNFIVGKFGITKTQIDKNNFIVIYNKWLQTVKPTIIVNWDIAKKNRIIDGDFYLADLLSIENETLKEKLFVLLKNDKYELDRKIDELGMFSSKQATFTDKQIAHNEFWLKYERPPREEYWDYIIKRRDLLVPQDIRERKGSFFTPRIWVELSQKYLSDVLGENWQDEYYIWDCAAGTGNLLTGLSNKYNIYASTLDTQDVEVMKDRIKNGANLLSSHVFAFDFLNDDFDKLPESLQEIINDKEKREKLVVYVNPPYAETNAKKGTKKGKEVGKSGVNLTKQRHIYDEFMGKGKRELYSQFMARIYNEAKDCNIAIFSKLKIFNAPFYKIFRNNFLAKLEKCFIVPADTFDNVKGQFPIGFQIWDTSKKEKFKQICAYVYDKTGRLTCNKWFYSYENVKYINNWIIEKRQKNIKNNIAKIFSVGSDFQHQSYCRLNSQNIPKQAGFTIIDVCQQNIVECYVYFAVRHCIKATWLNDRDQFLYPHEPSKNKALTRGHVPLLENNNSWQTDIEFQNDCLSFTLFHSQNRISAKDGTNHWIPFTEVEVNAKEKFASSFMTDFINGKIKPEKNPGLFDDKNQKDVKKLEFSAEAKQVFDAGEKLWSYYHQQNNNNVNASVYDIREHFQGRGKAGRMNNKSDDEKYMELIKNLRENLKTLAQKIEPKVYEYGFLKK
ncbi:MAG: hypothetical protein DRQ51_09420 [Gammaproteobacteria bacterium]|nr:MAG: hypothetical protein DRQ51_09420 [Gammaproteobacteria bacterium]